MSFIYTRAWTGPVEAVIFDWAGTTVDFGCVAPIIAFQEVFRQQGVEITVAEARGPMGTYKRDHIRILTEDPAIAARWEAVHGRAPHDGDVETMFQAFIPVQVEVLPRFATLIDGALDTVAILRERGIRIGSTTGYTTEMMAVNVPLASKQGYAPDVMVCASDVPAGRPNPAMCLKNAIELGITTVNACVKVDDSLSGIDAGLNAGMWTVGLAISGNEVGLSQDEWNALNPIEQTRRRQRATLNFQRRGAHYVIDTIADLPPVIDAIQARLARGEKP